MARNYAGILGTLAFAMITVRGVFKGDGVEAVLFTALGVLFTFTTMGYIIGWIAERTLVEAIETRFRTQLRAEDRCARPRRSRE